MKNWPSQIILRLSALLVFLGLALSLSSAIAHTDEPVAVNSLMRIEVNGPIEDLGLPVYAHLQDINGKEYALVITATRQLRAMDQTYRVFDSTARPESYLLALERRKGARALAAQKFSILHDDGRHIILRNDPAIVDQLIGLGFDLRVLPSKPMVLRAPEPAVPPDLTATYDSRVADMINEVHPSTLYDLTGNLTGENSVIIGGSSYTIATRKTNSGTSIQKATQYVYEFMESRGLAVSYQDWASSWIADRNVIGSKTGKTKPNEIVLITAHIDDMPDGGSAPGADDNASGSAAILMAAEIMASRDFDRTIKFVFFTGEEQGLYGSKAYADQAADNENIAAVCNMDMIAWDSLDGPTLQLHIRPQTNPGYNADLAIANLFVDVVNIYGLSSALDPKIIADGVSASDHSSFWDNGFAAILAIEDYRNDFNVNYHTVNDKRAYFNMAYFTNYVKAAIGTVAHLAQPAGNSETIDLSVIKSGSGNGTITSVPFGIDCGSTCLFRFNQGTLVTLTASPSPGSIFIGWSGGGCTGTGICKATMDSAKTVTAVFGTPNDTGTSVSGRINTNTIWSLTNSPYIVTGNVLVDGGYTLTIEPGVSVKFNSGTSLEISGTLIARGTDKANITFTSNQALPVAGNWGYILLNDSSIDAVYDGDGKYAGGSILEYCIVEYAGGVPGSNNGAVRINGAHPFIHYCTIRNNTTSGIRAWNLSNVLKIQNCSIDNNISQNDDGGGIYVSGGKVIISANTITNNKAADLGGAICVYGSDLPINMDNNHIEKNASLYGGGIAVMNGLYNITKNEIRSNESSRYGGGIYLQGSTGSISKNLIIGNHSPEGGGIGLGGQTTLVDNIFWNNSSTGSGSALFVASGSCQFDLINNSVIGNNGPSTIHYLPSASGYIKNNTFSFNTGSTLLEILNNPPVANFNNFITNQVNFTLVNNWSSNIDAKNNWWSTADDSQIKAKIFDWFDDGNKGLVDYSSFLPIPSNTAPISSPCGLTETHNGDSVSFAWNPNPESDLAGYKVYWGTKSGFPYAYSIDVGKVTQYTLPGLSSGTYYVTVTAYDTSYNPANDDPATIINENQTNGNESWYAQEKEIKRYTVTPSVGIGAGHGSITPNTAQTINHGSTASFTVTPESGYTASVGGTCGGNLVGTTYTTTAIIGACTVLANFIGDAISPTLTITSHTTGQHVVSANTTLTGTASDAGKGDNGISLVTVNGSRASNDTAVAGGTANWSKGITLSCGANTLTVWAYDNSSNQNGSTQSLTINYDCGPPPPNVPLQVLIDGSVFSNLGFGLSQGATDNYDQGIDTIAPPASPDGDTAYFSSISNQASPYDKLNMDYRAVNQQATLWKLVAKVAAGKQMKITWNPADLLVDWSYTYQEANSSWAGTGTVQNMKSSPQEILIDNTAGGDLLTKRYLIQAYKGFPLMLKAGGWNLISLPIDPTDTNPAGVFGTNLIAVYQWDAVNKRYAVPTSIQSKTGFWVAVSQDTEMQVGGATPADSHVGLLTGWNLVGPVGTQSVPFGSSVLAVYGWGWPPDYRYVIPGSCEEGKGYWIAASQDGEIW